MSGGPGTARDAGWTVLVPIASFAVGKTRFGPEGLHRATLARAIALDTLDAVCATPGVGRVVVVTAGDDVRRAMPEGVEVVREAIADGARRSGIDAALARAAATVGAAARRAALPADLAALAPAELGAALEAAAAHPRAVVADAEGTGTTLLTAVAGVPWVSAYGPASFARHVDLGFHPLEVAADSGLRCDLDTPAQLADVACRVGPRTAALAAPRRTHAG